MDKYTGQLMDGPEAGNVITSSVERVPVQLQKIYWLDGPDKMWAATTVYGDYVWDENDQGFYWELDYSE